MTKRWWVRGLVLCAVLSFAIAIVSGVQVGIVARDLEFVLPAGGVGQGKIFVQNDGEKLDAEFSVSRQLVPFVHIIPESASIFSVYAVVPIEANEQSVEGDISVQLSSGNSATTADVKTIEKRIPVSINIKGRLSEQMPFSVTVPEEPIVPLSFNALPIVLLGVVLVIVANAMLRRRI